MHKKEFAMKSGVRSRDFVPPSKKQGGNGNGAQSSNMEGEFNASFRPANYYCIAIGELVRK